MATANLIRLSGWTAFCALFVASFWLLSNTDASAAATKIDVSPATVIARNGLPQGVAVDFGPAPEAPSGDLSPQTREALDTAFTNFASQPSNSKAYSQGWGSAQKRALQQISKTKDPRLAWILSDAMRFVGSPDELGDLVSALNRLLGTDLKGIDAWGDSVDHLIAWDIPAPPNYLRYKRAIYTCLLYTSPSPRDS